MIARAFAAAALLAAASATGGPAQNQPRPARITSGLESAYYIAGMARAPHALADRMRHYRVPAVSIAVMDGYRVVWSYAAGLRDVAAKAPATTTTLFQAASMSKPVAAAGILALFERRGLSLDADANALLRSWQVTYPPEVSERVTMRRLLSHSAGTNVHGFEGYDRDAPLPTLLQVLDGTPPSNSEAVRVVATPGRTTEYSGGGTSIAQQLAVDVSGEPFPAFMRQTVLAPLGMTNSTFDQPLPQSLWPRAAGGYYGDGKPVHRGWRVYPTMAAAGLWTTPSDLAAFVIAIQNALRGRGKPPMDATVAREMTTQASKGFGLGPEVLPSYFSHNGANEGFQGIFIGLDRGGRGVVVMTNSDNGLLLADEVVHAVAKAYAWPVLQPQPKTAMAIGAATMRGIAGKYAANVGGERVTLDVAIGREAGAGVLLVNSPVLGSVPSRLYASTPLRYFTLAGATLDFARGKNGRVGTVRIGTISFTRVP